MSEQLDPGIISFYGTDGSGKSSIARVFTNLAQQAGKPTIMIGGSSYKDWLTPQVARETLGNSHSLNENAITHAEKIRLYEEIAVACYGYAAHLAEQGIRVTIDSDPILKRVIWSKIENSGEDYVAYMDHFSEYTHEKLSSNRGVPAYIVGINVSGQTTEADLLDRIIKRGSNSDFDPKNIHETRQLTEIVDYIWEELQLASSCDSKYKLLNRMFGKTACLEIANPNCHPSNLNSQVAAVAQSISQTLTQ